MSITPDGGEAKPSIREAQVSALRGHGPKIEEAVAALEAEGQLPPNLRPGRRDQRILAWLAQHGYAADLPSRAALGRYFDGSACKAGNSVETVSADGHGEDVRRAHVQPIAELNDAQQSDARG
jgi:hypothetical protein